MAQPQSFRNKEEPKGHRSGNEPQQGGLAGQAGGLVEKAKDVAGEMARDFGGRASQAAATIGGGMESAAEALRQRAPREGFLGTASGEMARTLESGGRYLKEEGFTGMMDDLSSVIRRNPLPAVLIGIGIGFLLARTTSRS